MHATCLTALIAIFTLSLQAGQTWFQNQSVADRSPVSSCSARNIDPAIEGSCDGTNSVQPIPGKWTVGPGAGALPDRPQDPAGVQRPVKIKTNDTPTQRPVRMIIRRSQLRTV
ncbi:hypothetical protein IMCC21224_11750 [Puniceibacterium sp. IMCC21224]|nr:hypothetical protein IMCC21224_11750 [Puniceibacterium sp. IMCC21224]